MKLSAILIKNTELKKMIHLIVKEYKETVNDFSKVLIYEEFKLINQYKI